jgi:hypothetical protein
MSKRLKLFILALIAFSFSVIIVNAYEIDVTSRVTNIVDGDTFDIANGERIRLGDVSAPEVDESGGSQATSVLTNLIDGKKVYLDTDPTRSYGRLVSVVYIKHNSTHYKNINWVLLQNQYFSLTNYPNEFNPSSWTKFERYAENPTPPPDPEPAPEPELPSDPEPQEPTPEPPSEPDPDPKPPSKPILHYTLTISTEGQGTVFYSTNTTTFEENSKIILVANPSETWTIHSWYKNGHYIGNTSIFTFNITQDTEINATFVKLTPKSTIQFQIQDEHSFPIDNTTIKCVSFPKYGKTGNVGSNEDGYAEISSLLPGKYTFQIEKNGYDDLIIPLTLVIYETHKIDVVLFETKPSIALNETGQEESVTIEIEDLQQGTFIDEAIEKKYSISGTISDIEGTPLQNISIVSNYYPEGQVPLRITSNEVFNFSDLLLGNYIFRFEKNGFETYHKSVYLSDNESVELKIVLVKPAKRVDSSVIVPSIFIGAVVIALYLRSEKSISFYQVLDKIVTRSTISESQMESFSLIEPPFYGSDKGIIINALCKEGTSSLSDIRDFSDIEDDRFWIAFYELLSEGSVESSETGGFFVTKILAQQWKQFLSQDQ